MHGCVVLSIAYNPRRTINQYNNIMEGRLITQSCPSHAVSAWGGGGVVKGGGGGGHQIDIIL